MFSFAAGTKENYVTRTACVCAPHAEADAAWLRLPPTAVATWLLLPPVLDVKGAAGCGVFADVCSGRGAALKAANREGAGGGCGAEGFAFATTALHPQNADMVG